MLIDSPRLTDRDRQAWARLERYDAALARDARLDVLSERASRVLRDAAGSGYAGTTWGKDSTVLCHLIATSGVHIPVVWVRVDGLENPDTEPVRDAFLSRWDLDYHEITIPAVGIRRWWHGADFVGTDHGPDAGFALAAQRWGARHISGVRAEESTTRRLTIARNGLASAGSVRPIGDWTAQQVFAYLHRHDLPIHPAYAMTRGGQLDRRHLRVSTIGGTRGTGKGRREWEAHYYPDVIQAAKEAEKTWSSHDSWTATWSTPRP